MLDNRKSTDFCRLRNVFKVIDCRESSTEKIISLQKSFKYKHVLDEGMEDVR